MSFFKMAVASPRFVDAQGGNAAVHVEALKFAFEAQEPYFKHEGSQLQLKHVTRPHVFNRT
jgi:hypothetical protein